MAQKRMFDRSITETEKFLDMPMSSKGLYFLLGMAADDEGFVSAKSVLRVHGGTDDDLNILLHKGFCIRCPSGVIVITHWRKNNWLDSRRLRKTEYIEDKKFIALTNNNDYVLSDGLARIEESRVEENRKDIPSESGNANTEVKLTQEEMSAQFAKGRQLLGRKISPQNQSSK